MSLGTFLLIGVIVIGRVIVDCLIFDAINKVHCDVLSILISQKKSEPKDDPS